MFSCPSAACIHAEGPDIAVLIAFLQTWNNPRIMLFAAYLAKSALDNVGQLHEVLAAHCVHTPVPRGFCEFDVSHDQYEQGG